MRDDRSTKHGGSDRGDVFGNEAERQGRGDSGFSKLLTRVAFGFVYVASFVVCLLAGRVTTALYVSFLSWFCCFEFYRMMKLDGKIPNEFLGLTAAILFPLSALVSPIWLTVLIFVMVLSLGLWYVWTPRTRISDVAVTAMGPLYTGFMLSAIVLIRDAFPGVEGAVMAVGVCASLWASDSFAYLVGSKLGRHKMVPKISPKKSWEGFFGGLVGSVAVWVALRAVHVVLPAFPDMPLAIAVAGGLATAVFGVFGDLIESRIKRGVGVKDSGNLIPGHGGMLDRNDSLIFGCITAYFVLAIGGIL